MSEVIEQTSIDDAPVPQRLPSGLERAIIAARLARDNKGRDIIILDMRKITPIYDFFVMSTGNSRRQIRTIAEETDRELNAVGDRRQGIEGYETSRWILQDYGDIVVHVFEPAARSFYELEELWTEAPRIDWAASIKGE